ncbi:MAG: ribonuclease D [Chthoniobacteraceae bacterium]
MVPLTETAESLAAVLPHLEPHEPIAVDTEADSLHCYFEKLCLIQISVPGSDFLIDPLAGFDLGPLWTTWAGKQLLFHGADYDLRLLRRSGCPMPARIFDTMLAARLCGIPGFSYAALVERYCGITIAKASQKANWASRPLSPLMLDYAVNDTRHLSKIAGILEAELRRLGRMAWFEQSCERAIRSAEADKEIDPEQLWRIPGSGHLRGRAAAIFRELWKWRDEEAQRVDKPTFHILHSERLVDAALKVDAGERIEFRHLRGSRAQRFHEAAKRGMELDEREWPKVVRTPRQRPSQAQFARFLELKKHRDHVAEQVQLDPSLIAAKAILEGLAFRPEETLPKLLPWQRELMKL